MSAPVLPAGAFLTTIDGRRCTAVPRAAAPPAAAATDAGQAVGAFSVQSAAPAPAATTAPAAAAADDIVANTAPAPADTSLESSPTSIEVVDVLADSPQTALPEISASPAVTDSEAGVTPLFTTIGANPDSATTDTPSANPAISAVSGPNSNSVQTTVAVAGGVIGGVVLISIAAFVIWWWRRRVIKKRRSTLLTPLDVANSYDRDEKGAYVINRGSIGPTPVAERFRAALGYNMKKFRGRMSRLGSKGGGSPSVNLDRGTSQFIDPATAHSRANSSASGGRDDETTKGRVADWWSRMAAGVGFHKRTPSSGAGGDRENLSAANTATEKRPNAAQPDFLTLLGMDDRELDREAQRRRASISRKNGSAGSSDNFLGGLNLSFGGSKDNPFSDANALAHTSAQPAPLVVSQPNNPFSDSNAIRDPAGPKPSTYVADMRRSRGQSVSAANRQPSTLYARESVVSDASVPARRNKFRSDPFDLERPELLAGARAAKNSITSSTAGTAGSESRSSRLSGGVGTGELRRPAGAHTRTESFTSKYSSGISMGDWSDPGPDVGPAASRWDGPEPRASPTQGWRDRLEREAAAKGGKRNSDGSQKSVGKAM